MGPQMPIDSSQGFLVAVPLKPKRGSNLLFLCAVRAPPRIIARKDEGMRGPLLSIEGRQRLKTMMGTLLASQGFLEHHRHKT